MSTIRTPAQPGPAPTVAPSPATQTAPSTTQASSTPETAKAPASTEEHAGLKSTGSADRFHTTARPQDGGKLTHIENASVGKTSKKKKKKAVQVDQALNAEVSRAMLGASTLPRPAQLARPGARSETLGYKYGGDKADLGTKYKYDGTVMNGGKLNTPLSAAERKADKLAATHTRLDKALAAEYPGGVEFKPPFKDPKSAEAADAKHALLHSVNAEKGGHQDRIVDLNGTKNAISAEISKAGKATVTLHGPGTAEIPATSTFKTVDEAKKALQKDFGVTVSSTPKAFALDELNKAHAAFSLTSGAERDALKGIVLERHTSLGGSRVAEFKADVDVGPPASYKKSIRVGDDTFKGDANSFVGSGAAGSRLPPSVQTLVHEAGHAVEAEKLNSAMNTRNVATEAYNKHTLGDYKSAADTYYAQTSGVSLQRPALKVNGAIQDVDKKTQALSDAKTDSQVKTAKTALATAIKNRDAALAKLPDSDPTARAAKDMAAAQDTRADLARTMATARAVETTASGPGDTSARLQSFSKYVKDNKILPFTDYAAKEGAQEFYAEAYSLYRTDPQWMKANSPKLFEYFEKNKHVN
ncbi:MAG: hypothetical protein ABIJ09_01090 [Pseudomonadota bacterium]